MKKLILTSFVIFSSLFLINTQAVHAQMGSMMGLDNEETEVGTKEGHTESVEVVLQGILESQNVSTVQELDLSKVSDDDWERLGDAVMELQHPGEAHEVMDRMMGGEGSESLRQMHINMGQAYLGYGNSNYGPGMMMGGGMMGYGNNRSFNAPAGMMGFGSMMGYGGNAGVYGILGSVTWITLIVFLVAGAYFFIKQAGKK
jgi:hypothetical protein